MSLFALIGWSIAYIMALAVFPLLARLRKIRAEIDLWHAAYQERRLGEMDR